MSPRARSSLAAGAVLLTALSACGGEGRSGGRPAFEQSAAGTAGPESPRGSRSPAAPAEVTASGSPSASTAPTPGPDPAVTGGPTALPADTAYVPPAAGRYTLANTGSTTITGCAEGTRPADPTTELQIGPLTGARQEANRGEQDDGRQTSVVEYRKDGIWLVSLVFDQSGTGRIEFRPSEPVLLLPASPAVGRAWRWTVTSTDGKYTVTTDSTVEALRQPVQLGDGTRTEATRTRTVLRLTGTTPAGRMDVTITSQGWSQRAPALEVKSVTDTDGTLGTCSFTGHEESLLRSARPS